MKWLILLFGISFSQPEAIPEKSAATTPAASSPQPEYRREGYWVISPITGSTNRVLVLYYNEKNELVKKEWRSAEEADTTRGKVVRSLKRSLHEVLKLQRDEDLN